LIRLSPNNSYDGERNYVFSKDAGGEKQKISIARAILKDSDVVIFDEATSQQDAQSIERIKALIETRFNDKICIIISHRSIKNLKLTKTIRLQDGSIR